MDNLEKQFWYHSHNIYQVIHCNILFLLLELSILSDSFYWHSFQMTTQKVYSF